MAAEERFISRLDTSGGIDSCWPFVGARDPLGYGRISRTSYGETMAHRFMYRLATGVDPGEAVMHECDNPPCCNPLHLTAGTRLENNRQAWDRGLHPHGENDPKARLSNKQVADIRRRAQTGERQADLAREYQVHQSHICKIVARKVRNRED